MPLRQRQFTMKLLSLSLIFAFVACAPKIGPVTPKTRVERQMIGLLQKFDRWDDDGNGELNEAEIKQGLRGLKGKPQQFRYTAAEVIQFYDTDHSGTISLSEAQTGYYRANELEGKLPR